MILHQLGAPNELLAGGEFTEQKCEPTVTQVRCTPYSSGCYEITKKLNFAYSESKLRSYFIIVLVIGGGGGDKGRKGQEKVIFS